MQKWIVGISVFLCLYGCSLSASQEQALNKQTGLYLNALNEGPVLAVIAKTHPEFVRYTRNQGADHFRAVFQPTGPQDVVYSDPVILQTRSSEKQIHVLYRVQCESFLDGEFRQDQVRFVAISSNDGKTWFYIPYPVYQDKKQCPGLQRILK